MARLPAFALIATLAIAEAPTTTRAGSQGSACPADGTRRVPLPGGRTSLATDIVAVGGRAGWVVGTHAGRSTPRRPWIVRRGADGWRIARAVSAATDSGLMAVDARGRSAAWTVGFAAVGRFLRPIAQRWNGGTWVGVRVPMLGRSEALVDVAMAAGGSTWAVGYRTTGRGPTPVVLERRPSGWIRRDPSLPARTFGALTAVDVTADGTPWAVGWQGDGRALRPLLLRWSGGRWTQVRTGLAGEDEAVLTDIVADRAPGIHLLGYRRHGDQRRALLWTMQDGRWAEDAALDTVAGAFMADGLALDGAGRVRVAGSWRGDRLRGYAAAVAGRTDDGWRIARAPDGLGSPSHLRAIAWADGAAWAVGWTGGEGVASAVCDLGRVPIAPTTGRRVRTPRGPAARAVGPRRGPRQTVVATPTGSVRFRDVAGRVGLPEPTTSHGATVLDIDGDGWQDLLISRHTEQGRVLRNRRGRFVAAAADPLGASDRHGCAAADVDRDGLDEAYCAVGAARGAKLKSNELWLGLATAQRRQRSPGWGVDDPLARGRRAAFVDLDGDPYPDLVVTSDPLRVDALPSVNRAFRDVQGRGLVPAHDLGLELPIGGACVLGADLDDDGVDEVVVCTEEAWAGKGPGVHVFRRGRDRFQDATNAFGVRAGGDVDAAVGDLDGDGRTDLVQVSRSRLTVSLQRQGAQSVVATLGLAAGTAVAIGDADGDRDLDIYVVEGGSGRNAADRLFLNGGNGRAWRQVAIPQAGWGSADDVVVLDHDRNGTDDFLVLNGAQGRGPVQLIAGFR